MNTEEKAKRYDNIIEKANKMHHENCETCQMCIEELIPELKESGDERIRKEIIYHIQYCDDTIDEIAEKRMIAWLEKQGEQKPAEDRYMEGYLNGVNDISKTLKPAVWSEEDEKMIQDIINDIAIAQEQVYCKSRCEDEINWLKSLKGRVQPQPKQEWSEEDEKMLNQIIKDYERGNESWLKG